MQVLKIILICYFFSPLFSFGDSRSEMPGNEWRYKYYSGVSDVVLVGRFNLPNDSSISDKELFDVGYLDVDVSVLRVIKGDALNSIKLLVDSNYFEYKMLGISRLDKKNEIYRNYLRLSNDIRKFDDSVNGEDLDGESKKRYEKLRYEYVKYRGYHFNDMYDGSKIDLLIRKSDECVIFLNKDVSGKVYKISGDGKGIICDKALIQSLKASK